MAVVSERGRVVAGVEASGLAAGAVEWAAAEAAERGAALYLVHAVDFDPGSALIGPVGEPPTDPARSAHLQILARAEQHARAAHPELPVVAQLLHCGAADALIDASRDADLLVVGTHGHGDLAGAVLGSVSQRVIVHGHCPVVVVRSPLHAGDRTGEIVLGMDNGASRTAVRFAFEAAARAGTAVRAVHAWVPYPGHAADYISDTDILARHAAEDMVAAMKDVREEHEGVAVKISVVRGHPVAVLAAASRGARLTVVGIRRRHRSLSIGIGPVISGLLGHAESPVVVVPHDVHAHKDEPAC